MLQNVTRNVCATESVFWNSFLCYENTIRTVREVGKKEVAAVEIDYLRSDSQVLRRRRIINGEK